YRVLSGAGITTVAMRDVPEPGFDVPACLSRRAAGVPFQMRPCEYRLEDATVRPALAAQTAAARGLRNIALIDMTDLVCASAVCDVVQRGDIVYRDDDHLTATFSRRVAAVLSQRLTAAIGDLAGAR